MLKDGEKTNIMKKEMKTEQKNQRDYYWWKNISVTKNT